MHLVAEHTDPASPGDPASRPSPAEPAPGRTDREHLLQHIQPFALSPFPTYFAVFLRRRLVPAMTNNTTTQTIRGDFAGCRWSRRQLRKLGFGCRLGSRTDQTEVMRECRADQHAEEGNRAVRRALACQNELTQRAAANAAQPQSRQRTYQGYSKGAGNARWADRKNRG